MEKTAENYKGFECWKRDKCFVIDVEIYTPFLSHKELFWRSMAWLAKSMNKNDKRNEINFVAVVNVAVSDTNALRPDKD